MTVPAPEIEDIYQRLILDHSRHPQNFAAPVGSTHTARGDNPFCGDRVTVSVVLAADRIADIGFEGVGCAISIASASMMTVAMKGLTRHEAEALWQRFESLLKAEVEVAASTTGFALASALGELSAFTAVSRLPVRVKCARLAWQTLRAALAGGTPSISTE